MELRAKFHMFVRIQVVPKVVVDNMASGDEERIKGTMRGMMKAGKVSVEDVKDAVEGRA